MSTLPPELVEAYRQTYYGVPGGAGLTLVVDQYCPALAEQHACRGVASSAVITACNPFSTPLGQAENAERHRLLDTDLRDSGFLFVEALGWHPSNNWPAEPSYLIFGIDQSAARDIGRRYQQNAIIWSGPDAVPQLLLLR